MTYYNILFEKPRDRIQDIESGALEFFTDLNLDQIFTAIIPTKPGNDLKPFFAAPLRDELTILYRHEIFQDLENGSLRANINRFTKKMATVNQYSALIDRKSTRLNSSHIPLSRMPSSA